MTHLHFLILIMSLMALSAIPRDEPQAGILITNFCNSCTLLVINYNIFFKMYLFIAKVFFIILLNIFLVSLWRSFFLPNLFFINKRDKIAKNLDLQLLTIVEYYTLNRKLKLSNHQDTNISIVTNEKSLILNKKPENM